MNIDVSTRYNVDYMNRKFRRSSCFFFVQNQAENVRITGNPEFTTEYGKKVIKQINFIIFQYLMLGVGRMNGPIMDENKRGK